MALQAHGRVSDARLAELAAFTADHQTTARLTRDVFAAGLDLADIVAMDEYSLELVVPLPDGLTLVYGTT